MWPAVLAAVIAASAAAAELTPDGALELAIGEPSTGYAGRAVTTRWYGDRARSSEYRISFMPPGRYRREYLTPQGATKAVSVSDGDREWIYFPRKGKAVTGDAIKSLRKVLDPGAESTLLHDNYSIVLSTSDPVAGREAWSLTLVPKSAGKSRQTFAIDKQTGAVLESRRFQPQGGLAVLFKFNRFQPGPQPLERFAPPPETSSSTANQIDPDFMTLAELDQALGEPSRFPAKLHGGFVFESADLLNVGKNRVGLARYTDGLAVISIFRTRKPVRIPRGLTEAETGAPSALRLSAVGHVLGVTKAARHYTFVGDVSASLLSEIGAEFAKADH